MTLQSRIMAIVLVVGFTAGTVLFSGWAIYQFLQENKSDESEETAEVVEQEDSSTETTDQEDHSGHEETEDHNPPTDEDQETTDDHDPVTDEDQETTDDQSNQEETNQEIKIMDNFEPQSKPIKELEIIDTVVGKSSKEVKPGDDVTVDYVGAFMANGQIFDQNKDTSFNLNGVISRLDRRFGRNEGRRRAAFINPDRHGLRCR